MNRFLVHFVMLLAAVAGHAQSSESAKTAPHLKSAWEWSDEERIAARANPTMAAERARTLSIRGLRADSDSITKTEHPSPHVIDIVDGNRNPELFLPTELFELLTNEVFVEEDSWRNAYTPHLAGAGLPADFWDRLAIADGEYLSDLMRQHRLLLSGKKGGSLSKEIVDERISGMSALLCQHRAEALARARHEFGISLDRFLYVHVASGTAMYFEEPADPERLRANEGGCR
jgi:hypothetical protein